MDDDFGVDDDFLAALAAADPGVGGSSRQGPPSRPAPGPARAPAPRGAVQQPTPQRIPIQQPTPQRLDRAPPPAAGSGSGSGSGIVQPTPQALPSRISGGSGSTILVSPRQKGNPVLACLRSMPWEYSDIVADYGLGLTTCALFLSLKYHRLHPEYIYTRIRNLQGKYNLRILLTMVDIANHEDSLRELAKTSLVNNVTVILCWSAAEAARYLELYKSYEHVVAFDAIRGQQATGYAERLVEFVTVPRAINKADAVALVGTFGSLREAVNAGPERVGGVGGFGEKKVRAWCRAVEEPFRVGKAKRRGGKDGDGRDGGTQRAGAAAAADGRGRGRGKQQLREREEDDEEDEDEDEDVEALFAAAETGGSGKQMERPKSTAMGSATTGCGGGGGGGGNSEEGLSEGIAAALARLREKG